MSPVASLLSSGRLTVGLSDRLSDCRQIAEWQSPFIAALSASVTHA